jgi:hypothetical protein
VRATTQSSKAELGARRSALDTFTKFHGTDRLAGFADN